MAKKIVQLENKDGDQIFPISATDIALPGTKVKTEFKASGGDIAAQTDTVLVTETIATQGDYAVIGSVDILMGSSGRVDVHLYHNGSTQLAQQYTTPISDRAGLTIIGRLNNASEGDTVSLNVRCDNAATTNSRTQGLVLIKLPEGAPTYKGGALVVTLNTGGMGWSGATTSEMYNAIHNGKPVVLQGAGLDSGYALLQSMNISVRYSWGAFIDPYGKTKYIRFDDTLDMWRTTDMTVAESYNTYEMETGGTWINGKPIYKKTLTRASGISTGNFTVAHGINDLATVIDIKAISTNGSGNTSFPAVVNTSGGNFWNAWSANPTSIEFYSSVTTSNPLYITIYYTKTTD